MRLRKPIIICWLLFEVMSLGCATTPTGSGGSPSPPGSASAAVGDTTLIAIAPPAPQVTPLPDLLGISGMFKGICAGSHTLTTRIQSRLGSRFPGLEPRPPMVPITDPSNMSDSASPSMQAAAEMKQQQDMAPQEVKAINFLARMGCSKNYPNVENALLSALDDPNETIRYEAVKGLRSSNGSPCQTCSATSCCSEPLRQKLHSLAFDRDDTGCFKETSARVRRIARLALDGCGGIAVNTSLPTEGPTTFQIPNGEQMMGESESSTAHSHPKNVETHDETTGEVKTANAELCDETILSGTSNSETNQIDLVAFEEDVVTDKDVVLARVNGEPIYESELSAEVEKRLDNFKDTETVSRLDIRLATWRQVTNQEIEKKLLQQAAYQAWGPVINNATSDVEEQWLLHATHFSRSVPESETRKYYDAHRSEFREGPFLKWERISIVSSQIPSTDTAHAIAKKIRQSVSGNVPLSPEITSDLFQVKTSDWTPLSAVSNPDFLRFLQQSTLGEISPIMTNEQGPFFVRVLAYRSPQQVDYSSVRDKIKSIILDERRSLAETEYLSHLRNRAVIWSAIHLEPQPLSPSD